MYLKWWTLPLKIEDTLKMDEKKMSRSMLDVAAYFVAKNRIHNSDDLWFGNENQVGFMVHEWKSDWVYGSGMKIRLGLWFMNENQVGFIVQGWKSGWVSGSEWKSGGFMVHEQKSGWDYGSGMKIRLGLWFMNENQVGFMVHEWKSGWVYGSGIKIRLGLWFMNENQVGLWFMDKIRLGLWFMDENQVGFMVQGWKSG